jgi:hypothetical protein
MNISCVMVLARAAVLTTLPLWVMTDQRHAEHRFMSGSRQVAFDAIF